MGSGTSVAVGRYLVGVAGLLITFGSLGLAAVVVRRRWLPDWDGALARLAETVLVLALLTGLLELLGTVRLFSLVPIVLGSVLLGGGIVRAVGWHGGRGAEARRQGGRGAEARGSLRPQRVGLLIASLIAAAATLAEWAGPTVESYRVGIRTFDSLWYHLPWAASFAQTGEVTSLRFTDVEYLTPFYPATSEMLHGAGLVLLSRDTLSPGLNLVWLGLVFLAAYCVGRPRGLGALTMTGAALAMATPMVRFSQAGSAANDVVGVFFVLAAVALVVNGGGRRAAIALAGVAAGLALSVKLSMVAPVLALTVGVLLVAPPLRPRRSLALVWLGPLALAGGFWYLRNLIAVGNPLPWLAFPGLATPTAPLQQHTGFSVAHYLLGAHGGLGRVAEPGLASGLGPWWAVIVALAVVGPLLCLLSPQLWRFGSAGRNQNANPPVATPPPADCQQNCRQSTTAMLGMVALASLAAYLVTPETAAGPAGDPAGFAFNLRYAAPALALALTVLPLAPVLDGDKRRIATLTTLLVVLTATLAQGRLWPSSDLGPSLAIAALAAAATALIVVGRRRRTALAATITVTLAAGGYALQRSYLEGRYVYHPGVSQLAHVWAFFRTVHDSRVGLVGTFGGFFGYPLSGADASNTVEYIAARGAHGSFTAIATCAGWRAHVNAGHFRYLVITPARDPWRPRVLTPSPENEWTKADPHAHPVYTRNALGQPIVIYELDGPLNPRTCPPPSNLTS